MLSNKLAFSKNAEGQQRVFIAKSVMFTFLSLFLVPLIFVASKSNLLTYPSIFSIRASLRPNICNVITSEYLLLAGLAEH